MQSVKNMLVSNLFIFLKSLQVNPGSKEKNDTCDSLIYKH